MSITIRLTIDDAALRRAIQDPQLIAGPLKDFLNASSLQIEAEAKQLAPVGVSGGAGLKGSITSVLEPTRAHVQSNVFYAPYVEFGTRPHWVPVEALMRWVYLKVQQGQLPRRRRSASARSASQLSTRSLAFLIARSISRHGTKPHPFMRPAVTKSLPRIREYLREMAQDIERRWKR